MADDDLIPSLDFTDQPQEPTPEPVVTPEAAPVAAPVAKVEDPTMVPLAALQAERASNRSLKDRLDRIEGTLAQKPAAALPDVFEDPQGFQRAVDERVTDATRHMMAEVSERLTRTAQGDAVVDEAFQAAEAAGVIGQFNGRKDGWGDLVKWHKSQKALSEIGDDPAAYAQRVEAEMRTKIMAEMAVQSVKPALASPSLAGQPNVGTRAAPAWSGPTSLDDVLGNGSKY